MFSYNFTYQANFDDPALQEAVLGKWPEYVKCGLYLPPVLIFLYNYGSKRILCEIYTEKDHPFIFCKVHNYSQRKVGTCIDNYVHHGLAKKFKILFTFIFFILILGRHFNMCSGMINKCPFYAKVFPPNITKSLLKYKIDLK